MSSLATDTSLSLCPWFGQMATLLILGSTLHYRKMASNSNDQSFYTAAKHTLDVRTIFQFRATCLSQKVALSCSFIKMFLAECLKEILNLILKSWFVLQKLSSPTSAPCGRGDHDDECMMQCIGSSESSQTCCCAAFHLR